MRKFRSLNPEGQQASFDAEVHGEEPIVKIEESKKRIVISYNFPGFYQVEDKRKIDGEVVSFERINIRSTGHLAKGGKPLLPSFGRYLQIPSGCKYKVSVENLGEKVFKDVHVMPAQQNLFDAVGGNSTLEYDGEFYKSDQLYPLKTVAIDGPFMINGYNALLIHVFPLQYNPAKMELIGYSNVIVTLNLSRDAGKRGAQPEVVADRAAFGNLFLNPRRGIDERLGLKPKARSVKSFDAGDEEPATNPEFLIIYHGIFEKAALKLAQWKNRCGISTECVPISSVGNQVSKIKKYIRGRRSIPYSNLRYLLLFGDSDMIPTEEDIPCYAPEPYSGNASDYYYSTDRDPTGPEEVLFSWLSVGRIPVRTDQEGMDVVDKIISYEKNPPADPSYYRRMVLAALFQDKDEDGIIDGIESRAFLMTMEKDILPTVDSMGFQVERIYVTDNPDMQYYNDGTPVPEGVKQIILDPKTATERLIRATEEGQLFIAHRGHGNPDGWDDPKFKVDDLDEIVGKMPTMFYSINCLTGKFDMKSQKECFAEKSLRIKGAAPSIIAATRVSNSWLNNDLLKGLFDSTFGGILPTFPGGVASYPVKGSRLGDILNYAKSYLPIGKSGVHEILKDHFEIYHVLGDPTLEVLKEFPKIVEIKAKFLPKPKSNVLDISISDCPAGGSLTVWLGDKLVKKIEPTSTHLAISLEKGELGFSPQNASDDRDVLVCFWAPGCRYSDVKAMRGLDG